jgi:hypothetical protein
MKRLQVWKLMEQRFTRMMWRCMGLLNTLMAAEGSKRIKVLSIIYC